MSPLTKAFVVLVTVLSILLVALVIPYVASTDDLQGTIGRLESEVSVANAAAKAATTDAANVRQNQAAENEQLQTRLSALLGENSDLRKQVTGTQGDLAKAQDRIDSLTASQQIANGTMERTTELLQSRTALLEDTQAKLVDLNRQNAEMITANNILSAEVNGLTLTNRTLQEQVADLNSQMQTLLARGDQDDGGGGGGGQAGPTVRGSVTEVTSIEGGATLVQLNVGRNDGITENTRFALSRGNGNNSLVGLVVIRSVDDNVSVGQILSQQREPRAGDAATTDF